MDLSLYMRQEADKALRCRWVDEWWSLDEKTEVIAGQMGEWRKV